MQYVGKLVSTVYNTITPNINPATLSGAIDVIVVERKVQVEDNVLVDIQGNPIPESEREKLQDAIQTGQIKTIKVKRQTTELASTPFHVRFGKMSVLRPAERKVTLHLNNSSDPLPFAMKVGETGEAFFVMEIDDDDQNDTIPADLVTSPILSAAASPITSPDFKPTRSTDEFEPAPREKTSDVEPLDLGEAQTADDKDTADDNDTDADELENDAHSNTLTLRSSSSTNLTVPSAARSPRTELSVLSFEYDQDSDKAHPKESGNAPRVDQPNDLASKAGSGPVAGAESLLGKVGNVASRAGGVVSAAGKAAINATPFGDPKLESMADKATANDNIGADVDQDHQDARRFDPEQGGAEAEKRQQDNEHASDQQTPHSETAQLEKQLQDLALKENGSDRASLKLEQQNRESYLEPFGAFPPSNPTNAAPLQQVCLDDETAVDDQDDEQDVETTSMAKARKSDVQYRLDMDGYKMTADGEDLAFREGNRFAHEMPLGKRHGGNGRNGHPEKLNGFGHRHKVSLPATTSAVLRRRSASRTHRPVISVDVRNRRASHSQTREAVGSINVGKPDASDQEAELAESNSGIHRSNRPSDSFSSLKQDELALSRDLARLARMNRASETALPGQLFQVNRAETFLSGAGAPSKNGRRASLSYSQPTSGRSTPVIRTSRTKRVGSRHIHEFSLSDTEAEVPNAKTASSRNKTIEPNDENRPGPSSSQISSSLRDLKLSGDESPPLAVMDDTATRHLGRSSELRWQWGDVSTSSAPPGAVSGQKRVDAYHSRKTGSLSSIQDIRRLDDQEASPVTGKLTSCESEPYVFCLELEDSCHSFELSLCYREGFGEDSESHHYMFEENRVSFQRFVDDEEVVNDERLVIKYNQRFLTWDNASAVLATLSLYRTTLSRPDSAMKTAEEEPSDDQQRTSTASYWSRWWNKSSKNVASINDSSVSQSRANIHRSASKASSTIERSATDTMLETQNPVQGSVDTASSAKAVAKVNPKLPNKTYVKTLRLTSDQLKSLNLRKGANAITFSVTSSYSGVATCTARIFLWEGSHKVVVSDIDGTITKSDALGHVFTMIGRDWTHMGVAKLYTDIARNGYRIMYLTSRAIGQADTTREYLKGIRQNNYQLPDGPVIMSPDRLIASLHREVILRKPEVFKMACLRDIARLFGADHRTVHAPPGTNVPGLGADAKLDSSPSTAATAASTSASAQVAESGPKSRLNTDSSSKKEEHLTPFYAGFGNRITDALSYRSVNIPSSRIFTIDSNGEVKMELLELAGYKSSYIHMTDLVDQMFPPITAKEEKEPRKPEFTDFNYWRPAIADIELPPDDELMGTPPVSPALSARSLRSVRSATSDGGLAGADNGEKPGRLSRFGLGSLGLSRKTSASTVPEGKVATNAATQHTSSIGPGGVEGSDRPRANSTSEPELTSTSPPSYGSGVTSWAASWRRSRAASPETLPLHYQRATSPLMGPVITAEPDSEDEDQERYHESGGGDEFDDDDVSSFGGGRSRLNSEEPESEDEGQEFDFEQGHAATAGRSRRRGGKPAKREATNEVVFGQNEVEGEEGDDDDDDDDNDEIYRDMGDNVMDDDDDPLLATGEIRFEWRG